MVQKEKVVCKRQDRSKGVAGCWVGRIFQAFEGWEDNATRDTGPRSQRPRRTQRRVTEREMMVKIQEAGRRRI